MQPSSYVGQSVGCLICLVCLTYYYNLCTPIPTAQSSALRQVCG